MTEIMAITRRAWLAVAISVVVQTSYHFYQGVPLALSHVVLFTGFAIFFLKTRSILPVAIAHSLVDVDATWIYGLRCMSPY
jgi:membrane protease YdiL (CAAX protease family)